MAKFTNDKKGRLGAAVALMAGADYYLTRPDDAWGIVLLLLVLLGGLAYIDHGTHPR